MLTVSEIHKLQTADTEELTKLAEMQLSVIDNQIRRVMKIRNYTTYSLPLTHNKYETKFFQTILYSIIVSSLKNRGFILKLINENKQKILLITWTNAIKNEEFFQMQKLIDSVTFTKPTKA